MNRIVIAGAGLAGLRVAEQLRTAGWTHAILALGDEPHPPYNRPPLTKEALRTGVDLETLTFARRANTEDVDWRLGTKVCAADLTRRTVTLADGEVIPYDGLVVATGVAARRLGLPTSSVRRHAIRTVEDASDLRRELFPGARVVVIGAGFIGSEVAATASGLGCTVTVVEPLTEPLERVLGRRVGAEVRRRHESHGVDFRLGRSVSRIDGDSQTTRVVLDDGEQIGADVVVEAVGSVANTTWLDGQGLDLSNGVLCDADLHPLSGAGPHRTVVAVGDVARFPLLPFGSAPHRIEHWTMPSDMASHAARALLAGMSGADFDGSSWTPLPSFWSDQYGTRIQSFGLPALGLDDVRLLEGDASGEAVWGYHRDDSLVGLVLIGMTRQMMPYRQQLAAAIQEHRYLVPSD